MKNSPLASNLLKELKNNTTALINKLLILILVLMITSCNTTDNFDITEENKLESKEATPFSINNNKSELNERIKYINRTATITPVVTNLKARGNNASNGTQEMYYWEHVAEVAPLTISGQTLSATHISFKNDKAYVSYHKQGDTHFGAVEIINLSNPNYPQITSRAIFSNADLNAVSSGFIDTSSKLKTWLAISDAKKGAQLFELESDNGAFNLNFRRKNLSNILQGAGVSASANGIAETDDYLYITTGKTHGGTVMVNKNTFEAIDYENYSNAKYVAVNGNNTGSKVVSLITGDNASIKVGDITNSLETTSYGIGSIFHQNVIETYRGKSTMEFSPVDQNKIYVAKGKDGIALVDVNTGNITNESKGLMLVVGNTNGVSTDNDYVYAANGSDGISISPHPTSSEEKIEPIFYWDLAEEDASTNYIKTNGEWVFVAKGSSGFKILRKRTKDEYKTITTFNNNGKPDGMEDDKVVCSTLLPNIYTNVLPERQNAITAHPEYFTNPVKTLLIQEQTELNLTFIDEGAGYRNVLGYYTYQEGNKPASADLVDKIVIFPNCSAQGSGGELIKGNTMRLLGTFDPGTVVSFFLIANGWRNGKITDGYYSQHSDIEYNISNRQQSILFYDATCNSIVIAFEDIKVPNGDNDFNDAIFEITPSNPNAIDTSTFIQISN